MRTIAKELHKISPPNNLEKVNEECVIVNDSFSDGSDSNESARSGDFHTLDIPVDIDKEYENP